MSMANIYEKSLVTCSENQRAGETENAALETRLWLNTRFAADTTVRVWSNGEIVVVEFTRQIMREVDAPSWHYEDS
jgi:hypothetical protein